MYKVFNFIVKYFVNLVCKKLNIDIIWKGKGLKEIAIDKKTQKIIIKCDKKYFRPTEVDTLLGNSNKARKKLKWKPRENIFSIVEDMINKEI